MNEDKVLEIIEYIVKNFEPCYAPEFMNNFEVAYYPPSNGNVPAIISIRLNRNSSILNIRKHKFSTLDFQLSSNNGLETIETVHHGNDTYFNLFRLAGEKQKAVNDKQFENELKEKEKLLETLFNNLKEKK
jgi:hypothetical protein